MSFTTYSYKIGLVKTLCDRANKINSCLELCKADLNFISNVLQKNLFPKYLIQKVFNEYGQVESIHDPSDNEVPIEPRYYKLPFVGRYSAITKNKIKALLDTYCSEIDIKLIFIPFKVGQYFSAKCQIPKMLTSRVVYKFTCANCNVCYIGETARHLCVRVNEHLTSDKKSAIYKHLQSNISCMSACSEQCFSIIDSAPTKHQLRIKESLLIGNLKPVLNVQVPHYHSKLVL